MTTHTDISKKQDNVLNDSVLRTQDESEKKVASISELSGTLPGPVGLIHASALASVSAPSIGFKLMKRFRTHATARSTISSNGAGILLSSLGVALYNAAGTALYQESAGFFALFDEYRVIRSTIMIQGLVDPSVKSSLMVSLGMNPNSFDADAAISLNSTIRLPQLFAMNTSANCKPCVFTVKMPPNRPWAAIKGSTSLPSLPDASAGAWWIANHDTLTVSLFYLEIVIRNEIEFRNRI